MWRSTRNEALSALLAVAVLGCGESALEDEPVPTSGPHPCDVGQKLTFTPLFDFESVYDANFSYYANPADPEGHTDVEPPGSDPNSAGLVEVDRCPGETWQSAYAIHLAGGGYVTYGPNFGWTIGDSVSAARDVSQESGVSFWAKTDLDGVQSLQIVVNDVYTFPVVEEDQRKCELATADYMPPLGARCWNGGVTYRTLSKDWRLYTVDFSELEEDTWGTRSPGGTPDLSRILTVEFHFPVEDSFDVWLDDIAFFKR